jgi:SAM-dependent methyltransferase
MKNRHDWNSEYTKPLFMRLTDEASVAVKDFVRLVRKEYRERVQDIDGLSFLDLGCGAGKNARYAADAGFVVTGIDSASAALTLAKKVPGTITYIEGSIGKPLPFADHSFDVAIDNNSSHCLLAAERKVFAAECARILKPGGLFMMRVLAKEGDSHSATLLTSSRGPEPETYIIPGTSLIEHPYTKAEIHSLFEPSFTIQSLEHQPHYMRLAGRVYKRRYWLAVLERAA